MRPTTDDYNYARFDDYVTSGKERDEFAAFPQHLHVGETAPDFPAHRLDDGQPVTLAELARTTPVVLEFGSFT